MCLSLYADGRYCQKQCETAVSKPFEHHSIGYGYEFLCGRDGWSLIDERNNDDQDVTDVIVSRRTVRSAIGYGTLWMGIYVTVPSFVRQFWLLQ